MSTKRTTTHEVICDECGDTIEPGKKYLEISDPEAKRTEFVSSPSGFMLSGDCMIGGSYTLHAVRPGPRQFCSWKCVRRYGKCECGPGFFH